MCVFRATSPVREPYGSRTARDVWKINASHRIYYNLMSGYDWKLKLPAKFSIVGPVYYMYLVINESWNLEQQYNEGCFWKCDKNMNNPSPTCGPWWVNNNILLGIILKFIFIYLLLRPFIFKCLFKKLTSK